MKDFVSSPWMSVAGLLAAMSVVCVVLVQYGYPWTGLALVSVAMSAAVVVALRPSRSMSQLIHDVDVEPVPVAVPTGGAQPGLKGKGTP